MRRYLLAAVLLAAIPTTGTGFTIAPLDPVHEQLAWISDKCAAASPKPVDGRVRCPFDDSVIRAAATSVPNKPRDQTAIESAVRWGDDPGHATAEFGARDTAGYLLQFRACDGQIRDDGKLNTIYRAGVMCSGHYGLLGFFHAMMSVDDAAAIAAAPGDAAVYARAQAATRDKILAWASFTYRVARGEISPDARFCSTVSKEPALAGPFSDGAGCAEADAKWTVRRFFTFACANPKLDKSCGTMPDTGDAAVRLAALGALLHTIQDSYAQGHVRRLAEPERNVLNNKLMAVIVCDTPKQFYFYDKTNRELGHSDGDAEPTVRLCGPTAAIDDPASAGATAIWMARGNRPTSLFMAYLSRRVFPLVKY